MSKQGDIRKFCLQGGGDSEEKDKEQAQREKRKLQQQSYNKKNRKRTIIETWLEEYDWVGTDGSTLFCQVCREFQTISDQKSTLVTGITSNYRKETLKFHDKSVKHQTCIDRKKALENPGGTNYAKSSRKADEKNSEVYEKLFNTAYYVASENEPFAKFPKLCALQTKNGLNFGTNYLNDKGCKMFLTSSSEVLREDVSKELENVRFISILGDGSTDKGIIEQELVYVRFVDSKGQIQTKLGDIDDLEQGNAKGVKDGWLKGLDSLGITEQVLAEKLVAVNTDGASVNLGKKGGAVKLLLDDINELLDDNKTSNGYVTVVHCIAHKLELAVRDAKKGCDYLTEFEKTLKGIFALYYYSPKKRRELYEIAVSLDQELKHYGGVQQIRWVASQNRALKALLDNYDITIAHLEEVASGRDDNAPKAKAYLKDMRSERFITFLHFMIDWTNLLSEVSTLFQQKKCLISEVGKRVTELKEKFIQMKTRRGKLLRKFLRESEDGRFRGNEMTHKQNRREQDTSDRIKADVNTLLEAAEFFLEERFIKHIGGEPHSLFNVFDFQIWPDKESEEFRVYGDEEIDKLVDTYSPLLSQEEKESIIDEWLDLKMYISRNLHRAVIDAYETFVGLMNSAEVQHMKHIMILILIMLTISPTTAECERGFSSVNNIKTTARTSMKQEALSSLVRIKVDGPDLMEYNPTESIINWLNSGKGTRHIKGHICTGPRGPKAAAPQSDADD